MSSRQKILVIDDEYDNAYIIKNSLERKGGYNNIDVFTDSVTALNNFQADSYDLIVIDVRMPYMNGFELYKKIKERDNKVKICFLSATENTHEEFKQIYPTLEENCFIKKPISPSELVNKIKYILDRKI
jgi:putative two-component system response regulator